MEGGTGDASKRLVGELQREGLLNDRVRLAVRAVDVKASIEGPPSPSSLRLTVLLLKALSASSGNRVLCDSGSELTVTLIAAMVGREGQVALYGRGRRELASRLQHRGVFAAGSGACPQKQAFDRVFLGDASRLPPAVFARALREGGRLVFRQQTQPLVSLPMRCRRRGQLLSATFAALPLREKRSGEEGNQGAFLRTWQAPGEYRVEQGLYLLCVLRTLESKQADYRQVLNEWKELGCPGPEVFGAEFFWSERAFDRRLEAVKGGGSLTHLAQLAGHPSGFFYLLDHRQTAGE